MTVTCPACRKTSEAPEGAARCPVCGAFLPAISDGPTRIYDSPGGGLDPADLLCEGQVLGGCRVERLLGHGGMGVVYLGMQQSLGRKVALKVLASRFARDESFVKRFDREAAALAGLNHPNIVAVYDKGVQDGRYYFAMEFVEGVSLREVLAQRTLRPSEILKVVPVVAEALDYAHAQGVVHRDIKPENLLLTRAGQPKIADFGLAHLAQSPQDLSLTRTRSVLGTRDYMAPEARLSAKAGDHRVDVYALGVVLYEILTGEMPLGRFPMPSEKGQDPRFDEVVNRALESDPARRFQRVGEIGQAVTRITAPPPSMPGRGDPPPPVLLGGRFGSSPPPPPERSAVTFRCSCGRSFTMDTARAGSEILCSGCGKILRVPAGKGAPSAAGSCPQCGEALVPGVPQCLKCGMPVRKMASGTGTGGGDVKPCPACARPIPFTALGCRHCGTFFDDPESLEAARAEGRFPWENREQAGLLGAGLATLNRVLFHPADAFARLAPSPLPGAALKFHLAFGVPSAALCLFWYAFLPGWLARGPFSGIPSLQDWIARTRIPMDQILIGSLLVVAALPLLLAVLAQAGLYLTGGAGRGGLGGTLAVALYVLASVLALAGILPFLGAAVAVLWMPVLLVIGIARVHACGAVRALLAVLLGPLAAAVLRALLVP